MKKLASLILVLCMAAMLLVVPSHAVGTLSRSGWKVSASSQRESYFAANMIDGRLDTYWHSNYQVEGGSVVGKEEGPYYLLFKFPSALSFSGFRYTPRTDNWPGIALGYEFYVCEEENGTARMIAADKWQLDQNVKEVNFGFTVNARAVILSIPSGNGGFGSCAEFDLLEASGSLKSLNDAAKGSSMLTIDGTKVSKGGNLPATAYAGSGTSQGSASLSNRTTWKVKATSQRESYFAANTIDGRLDTYWHSGYQAEGGSITFMDPAPFYLIYTLPEKASFSGFRYTPRTDNWPGIAMKYGLYVIDGDEGTAQLIKEGKWALTQQEKEEDFGFNVTGKTVIFAIEEGNGGYGSCAEFALIGAQSGYEDRSLEVAGIKDRELIYQGGTVTDPHEGERITAKDFVGEKGDWQVSGSSEYTGNPAKHAVDGNYSSFWHTYYEAKGSEITYKEPLPHELLVTLPSLTTISGFSYTPRGDSSGRVLRYEFYVTQGDDESWTKVYEGSFDNNAERKDIKFPMNIDVRRFRFFIKESVNTVAAVTEMDLIKERDTLAKAATPKELWEKVDSLSMVALDSSDFTATDNAHFNGSPGQSAIDGIASSAWHTDNATQYKYPFTLEIDMKKPQTFSQMNYLPRAVDTWLNGIWLDYDVEISDDGEHWTTLLENLAFEKSGKMQNLDFGKEVTTRYIRFIINEGVNGFATCCELQFLTTRAALEAAKKQNYYQLQIGSNVIRTVKNGVATEKTLDVAPFINVGSTLIPLRGLFEEMGAEITWDGSHQKITVDTGKTQIYLQVYNNLVEVTHPIYGMVRYTLPAVPQIVDSRTFVPVRFISENLGHEVEWDGETKTITIY